MFPNRTIHALTLVALVGGCAASASSTDPGEGQYKDPGVDFGEGNGSPRPVPPKQQDSGATGPGAAEDAGMDVNNRPPADAGPADTAPPPLDPGSFAAGTTLIATDDLNLRSGEGTTYGVILVIPAGSSVTVVTPSGANGWVNISYNQNVGYSSKDFLTNAVYDAARGQQLANTAYSMWNGHSSGDLCLKGVGDSLDASGVVLNSAFPRLNSAADFADWANGNPGEVIKRGFIKMQLDINQIPQGTIITWAPGQCGYHSLYGHIEIVSDTGSSKACSDFCGPIKKNCGAPGMFVPYH